jgi:hypothetical protein
MLSRVVLPVPVAPDTAMAIPAATMASSSRAVPGSRAFRSIRSLSWSRRRAKLRMVTTGPSGASGGSTAWNRSPPGRRASTQGRDSSTRSPSGATTRCTRAATAAAEANRTADRSMAPARSTHTSAGPLTMTSVTSGSASSGASGPRPVSSSPIERTTAVRSGAGSWMPSSSRASATAARRPSTSLATAPVAASRRWTRWTSPGGIPPARLNRVPMAAAAVIGPVSAALAPAPGHDPVPAAPAPAPGRSLVPGASAPASDCGLVPPEPKPKPAPAPNHGLGTRSRWSGRRVWGVTRRPP